MKTTETVHTTRFSGWYETSSRPWLEWGVTFFSVWFAIGLYLDGWAHANNLPDSFFTPWHGVIYSGFLGAALVLVSAALWAYRQGAPLRQALPEGYRLSLLGVIFFLLGGVGDLLWHTFLGIEVATEAFYSPPHLLLAAAGLLIGTGAFRAQWRRPTASVSSLVRVMLSLTIVLAILTFFSSEFHPFDHPWAWVGYRPPDTLFLPSYEGRSLPELLAAGGRNQDIAVALGMSSIIFQSGLLLALVLLAIRRWGEKLPFGWLTFMLTINGFGLSIFHDTLWTVLASAITGVVADALYRWLRPSSQSISQVRLFATAMPVLLYSLYFLAMLLVGGTWWSVHLWMGAIVLSGAMGWFVSYVIVPPPLPENA